MHVRSLFSITDQIACVAGVYEGEFPLSLPLRTPANFQITSFPPTILKSMFCIVLLFDSLFSYQLDFRSVLQAHFASLSGFSSAQLTSQAFSFWTNNNLLTKP